MDEGCAALIGILIVIGIVLAAIYFVLMAVAFALAYLGLSVIIPLDFFGSAFTWLGVSSPAGGWLLYGCFVGGVIGLVKGLQKAGRTSDLWKVYLGATALFCLLFFGSYAAYTSGRVFEPKAVQPVTSSTPIPITPSALQGTWTGSFSNKSASLIINTMKGSEFTGTLTVGQERIGITGTFVSGSRQITIKETRVLTKRSSWALGTDTGSLSYDGKTMSGTGKDTNGATYSWSFTK